MKILFISYAIGHTASGIISERILNELVKQGNDIYVITSLCDKTNIPECKFVCVENYLNNHPIINSLRNKVLSFFTQPFNSNYLWRYQAYRRAKKILKTWTPDYIYCRTAPMDPCFVGIQLKERYKIPLVVNLTDPIPPPVEYLPQMNHRLNMIKNARKIIIRSDIIGMANEQAINYQQQITGIDFNKKSLISPDPVPYSNIEFINRTNSVSFNLVYLGKIYGSRNIYPLIKAINKLRENNVNICLDIYGTQIKLNESVDYVRCHRWATKIDDVIANSDILVDLDGDDSEPIFISSKLKQYLVYNRPILSITPPGSPSSRLLKDLYTVEVVVNNVEDIYNSLIILMNKKLTRDNYYERLSILQSFSSEIVVENLIKRIATL